MARGTFAGGVHVDDGKDMSRDRSIQTVFPENGEMVFPLSQHIGKPSIPVVHVGDYVRTGQLIARADTEMSANLHASVSGRVTAIEERPTAGGEKEMSIVIENDGVFLEVFYPENRQMEQLNRYTVLSGIRNAGIVGMGGAGMPTYYKLSQADETDTEVIIANCVECEPYLTSDYRRILENPWKIINGLMVLLTIFPRAKGFIAVSRDNPEGFVLLRDLLRDEPRIFVKKVSSKFPVGSERQLIYALTGRSMNARMLPYDIGCLVCNTDTLVAINQAVIMNEPLITRIVTVTGDAIEKPCNFRVRIGMSYLDLLEQAGGFRKDLTVNDVLILDGGPMTGRVITDLNVPVTKLTSAIVVMRKQKMTIQPTTPCMRCGRCIQVCPNALVPLTLFRDAQKDNETAFVRHNGLECNNCGCCSYTCPSKLQLSPAIFSMKAKIMKKPEIAGDYTRRFMRK